jgi:hypothetical protein
MSRLYSSPEVTNLDALKALSLELQMSSSQRSPGTRHAHRIAVQLSSTKILPYVAVNKDAFPTSPAYAAGCFKSVRLPNKHRFLA